MSLEGNLRKSFQDVRKDIENLRDSINLFISRIEKIESSLVNLELKIEENPVKPSENGLVQIRTAKKKKKQ